MRRWTLGRGLWRAAFLVTGIGHCLVRHAPSHVIVGRRSAGDDPALSGSPSTTRRRMGDAHRITVDDVWYGIDVCRLALSRCVGRVRAVRHGARIYEHPWWWSLVHVELVEILFMYFGGDGLAGTQ